MNMIHGRGHRPLAGIALALTALSLFSIQDAIVKHLVKDYALFQILFMRSVTIIIPLFLILYLNHGKKGFATSRKLDHAMRVTFNFSAFLAYYFAVSRLPLANAAAIAMSTPLFLTALSGPLLGEPASFSRKILIVIGFIGVLIVIQPELGETDFLGAGSAVFGALMFAMLGIQTRKMSATEDTSLMVFFGAFGFLTATGIAMFWFWKTPVSYDWVILFGIGVIAGFAQYGLAHAYRYATTYTIAPFEYVTILWALSLGWIWFREMPNNLMLFGCLLIVICGITSAWIEKRDYQRSKTSAL